MILEKRLRLRLQREFGATLPRFDVLAALDRSSDGLTMGELSRQALMSNGNVTGLVARLIGEKLIVRKDGDHDRRVQRVSLTRKGRTLFKRMAITHERWIDASFRDLSDREITTLLASLAPLRQSIDRNPI